MAKEKKLTKAEHLEMELNFEQLRSIRLEKDLMIEKKGNKLLKMKVLELENQRVMQAMNNNLENMKKRIERAEQEVSSFNKKIKDKYKIKTSFGVNPDTGKLIEDE